MSSTLSSGCITTHIYTLIFSKTETTLMIGIYGSSSSSSSEVVPLYNIWSHSKRVMNKSFPISIGLIVCIHVYRVEQSFIHSEILQNVNAYRWIILTSKFWWFFLVHNSFTCSLHPYMCDPHMILELTSYVAHTWSMKKMRIQLCSGV